MPQGWLAGGAIFRCRKRYVKCPAHTTVSRRFPIENKVQPRFFAGAAFSLHAAVFI